MFPGIGAVFGVDATGAVFFNTAVPGSSCGGVFARAFCVCVRRVCELGTSRTEVLCSKWSLRSTMRP
jgi:hypothetical protein